MTGQPSAPTIAALLAERAVLGSRVALADRTRAVSYAELPELIERLAKAVLEGGVRPGDRVAVQLPNGVDAALAHLAVVSAGCIWVGVHVGLHADERGNLLAHSGAARLVDTPLVARPAARSGGGLPTDLDPDGAAVIAYTSGSTGQPKGVVHRQSTLVVAARSAARRGEVSGITGVYLPLSSINMQLLGPLSAIAGGGTCVCLDERRPAALAAEVQRWGIEHLPLAAPTVVDWLASADAVAPALDSLRTPVLGGSPVGEDVLARYQQVFEHRLTLGYGLTEAPASVTREQRDTPHRPGTSGQVVEHLQVLVVDEAGHPLEPGSIGRIVIGPAVGGAFAGEYRPMLGYWSDPRQTATTVREGKVWTGDLGSLDGDGVLTVHGRLDRMIIRGGVNIAPAEIEQVIRGLAGVTDVAVFGVPDDRLGQVPAAVVSGTVSAAQVLEHCAAHLARVRVPSRCVIVDRLPRSANGKLARSDLEQLVRR